MRFVPLSSEAVGETLARTIYAEWGDPLLREGTILSQRYIESLKARGIPGVYIKDAHVGLDSAKDALSDRTRLAATTTVRKVLSELDHNSSLPIENVIKVVDHIIRDIVSAQDLSAGLDLLRGYDEFIFTHSVNVCAYSVAMGVTLDFPHSRLVDVGVGALLHDLGKIRLAPELAQKPIETLSEVELAQYRDHAVEGYNLIRASTQASLLSAHVAYQHHERWDGTGFPRGLQAENIHEYGRIVAITNAFDNLASSVTDDGDPMPLHRAAALILRQAGQAFDPSLVKSFLKQLALYPVGTLVRLSNGLFGIVSRTLRGEPLRPVVRVLADRDNKPLEPYEIRLTDNPHLSIAGVHAGYPDGLKFRLKGTQEQHHMA